MGISKIYLLAYNGAQTLGWSYLAFQIGIHFAAGGSAGTLWSEVKRTVMIYQTLALMEVVHCVVRLVKSNPLLTAMQVASRLMLVWYVCYMSADSQKSLGVPLMLVAWSITEIIRYSYYACGLIDLDPKLLQFLRYTLFIVLYPMGVTGEMLCNYAALSYYARNRPFSVDLPNSLNVTFDSHIFLIVFMLSYLPFFPQLYLHMFGQRRKVLSRKKLN